MATYQSAWSQSSHEDCGLSVGCLTPRPPDPSVNLRDSELAEAVAQCVFHDTASQDKALWHTEIQVMFKGEEEIKQVTQQGQSRDSAVTTAPAICESSLWAEVGQRQVAANS